MSRYCRLLCNQIMDLSLQGIYLCLQFYRNQLISCDFNVTLAPGGWMAPSVHEATKRTLFSSTPVRNMNGPTLVANAFPRRGLRVASPEATTFSTKASTGFSQPSFGCFPGFASASHRWLVSSSLDLAGC